MDTYDLYERCVQSPAHAVRLLDAVHAANPTVLAEDFCGTAGVSRQWTGRHGRRAVAADVDPVVLAAARDRAGPGAPIIFEERNVIHTPAATAADIDVVFVGNFSIGEIHHRPHLVSYLARARARLAEAGVFVCDLYGGESAFRVGTVTRRHAMPDGAVIHYTWEQAEIDPLSSMVRNLLHFRVVHAGDVILDLPAAFEYCWRLWSVGELRDAMAEAGFARTSVHQSFDGSPAAALDPAGFIACIAAHIR